MLPLASKRAATVSRASPPPNVTAYSLLFFFGSLLGSLSLPPSKGRLYDALCTDTWKHPIPASRCASRYIRPRRSRSVYVGSFKTRNFRSLAPFVSLFSPTFVSFFLSKNRAKYKEKRTAKYTIVRGDNRPWNRFITGERIRWWIIRTFLVGVARLTDRQSLVDGLTDPRDLVGTNLRRGEIAA